jgi:hypothetical protein
MDEDFEYFLEKMGPGFDRYYVPTASIERYRGKLPDQLLTYWQEYGWCGYAEGLFWTVNPQEYEPVRDAWIGGTEFMEKDAYHIIARGAFGKLYFFGEKTGNSLTIMSADALALPRNKRMNDPQLTVRSFFSSNNAGSNDLSDADNKLLFARALKKLGRLQRDEMYGFVPALALGGPATLEHLQKVKAVEHLVMLAQLSELRVMGGWAELSKPTPPAA